MTAATMVRSESEGVDWEHPGTPGPYALGSPELDYLRNRTDYLAPGLSGRWNMFVRFVLGIAVNLAVVFGVALMAGVLLGRLYTRWMPGLATTANDGIQHRPFDVWIVIGLLVVGVVLAVFDLIWRPSDDVTWRRLVRWSSAFLIAAVVATAVIYVIPWMLEWLRHGRFDLGSGQGSKGAGALVARGVLSGLLALLAAGFHLLIDQGASALVASRVVELGQEGPRHRAQGAARHPGAARPAGDAARRCGVRHDPVVVGTVGARRRRAGVPRPVLPIRQPDHVVGPAVLQAAPANGVLLEAHRRASGSGDRRRHPLRPGAEALRAAGGGLAATVDLRRRQHLRRRHHPARPGVDGLRVLRRPHRRHAHRLAADLRLRGADRLPPPVAEAVVEARPSAPPRGRPATGPRRHDPRRQPALGGVDLRRGGRRPRWAA